MKLASYFAFVELVDAAVIANQDLAFAEEVVPDLPVDDGVKRLRTVWRLKVEPD